MDRFEEMQNFVNVVEAGSITRAADLSHVAKSAVSRRLSELESRLGVQLLNRTTRRMALTDAGRRFYDDCGRIITELEAAEAGVLSAEAALGGRIRLAVPVVFGRRHLGPAIHDFLREHPDIQFDIEFNDRHVDIVEAGIDLAIRITELRDSRMIARRLARVTVAICASPEYWERHGKPKHPQDLARYDGLHYSNRALTTWPYRTPKGKTGNVRVPSTLRANNGDYLLDAAIRGLGVIHAPRFIVCDAIQSGQLESVFADHQWNDYAVYAVFLKTRHLPIRIRALIDFLIERWGDEPYWEQC